LASEDVKKRWGYKNSQVWKTPMVKVDRNKNLTLNRSPLGMIMSEKQNKSDQMVLKLFTNFGPGNC
jgi:hypothetical protein